MTKIVNAKLAEFEQKVGQTIGYIDNDLECRTEILRKQETNSSDFVADVIRRAYKTDCVIIDTRSIRANKVIKSGKFTFGDIIKLAPFQSSIVILKVTGKDIITTLEECLKDMPTLLGWFPAISGLKIIWDPQGQPMNRVIKASIQRNINAQTSVSLKDNLKDNIGIKKVFEYEPINPNGMYTIATRENFPKSFKCLQNSEVIVDDENGLTISNLLRNFFWAVDCVNRLHNLLDNKNGLNGNGIRNERKLMRRLSVEPEYPDMIRDSLPNTENNSDEMDTKTDDIKNQSNDDKRKLIIIPVIDGRIIEVGKQDMNADDVNDADGFEFHRMPSFVDMDHLPRQESLVNLIDSPTKSSNVPKFTLNDDIVLE
eukprot:CAMPEP_0114660380 /NCGR_PEP_ID=MMETSP0191-20121206/19895_1 /TAXON_ID=126664 /ORGANISM="Sorites sp." /LENGTH=369 /DNA_ID=CAMNT_0001888755 /DNA_START=115 /DNA_END=1224 /DNA_ORIENTATION=-